MLEIYMEAVDDLLVDKGKGKKKSGGLKVRQNPKLGSFYVEGLSKIPVSSYEEISNLMDQGAATFDIVSDHFPRISQLRPYPVRAMCCALLRAYSLRMLIGARDPIL